MATGSSTVEDQATAATRLDGKFCLALRWDYILGSAQLNCSEYLPRTDHCALHSPEKAIMMVLAKGITLSTAEQWVRQEGLRGAIKLPHGEVCMWSGGVPILEYGSEDWLELARRTLEETRFGSSPSPGPVGTICSDLPPLEEMISRAKITFAKGVYLAVLP